MSTEWKRKHEYSIRVPIEWSNKDEKRLILITIVPVCILNSLTANAFMPQSRTQRWRETGKLWKTEWNWRHSHRHSTV